MLVHLAKVHYTWGFMLQLVKIPVHINGTICNPQCILFTFWLQLPLDMFFSLCIFHTCFWWEKKLKCMYPILSPSKPWQVRLLWCYSFWHLEEIPKKRWPPMFWNTFLKFRNTFVLLSHIKMQEGFGNTTRKNTSSCACYLTVFKSTPSPVSHGKGQGMCGGLAKFIFEPSWWCYLFNFECLWHFCAGSIVPSMSPT